MSSGMAVVIAVALAGCGGGGGGGGGSAPEPTATTVVPASATPVASATASSAATATTAPVATPSATPEGVATPTLSAVATLAAPTATLSAVATLVPPSATHAIVAPTATPTLTVPVPAATATPTATPLTGPIVSAFGLADSNGTFDTPAGQDVLGRPVFGRQVGDGFILFVEGRPGASGLPVATNLLSSVRDRPEGRPDLQIQASRALGDGSGAVCDRAFPNDGGVPAVEPPSFAVEQAISDAMNDLSCRFRMFLEPNFACTQDNNGNFRFASLGSSTQFCTLVNEAIPFPAGDTVLRVRLRDTAGNAGPVAEIVVRVRGF